MLIDLYELLQEEDGFRKFNPTFDTKEFKTTRETFPVKEYDIELSFHNDLSLIHI